MKFYVASSWRNEYQQKIVQAIRVFDKSYEVYDFRNPTEGDHGFHWSEIDPDWKTWNLRQYNQGLTHILAVKGFKKDMDAMKWADICVLVLPSGRSAHAEAGWMVGQEKPVIVFIPEDKPIEPELMYKMFNYMAGNLKELERAILTLTVPRCFHPVGTERREEIK